ncbi:MAG TPA: WYL domain-containing protein [Rhodocyclaceae bacterium]|nr:WYL domain-containing protein [Rhodocyclaceae bacterium]
MSADDHDTLVYRLAQILIKLNQGEKLDPAALADQFSVNLRTIQRDLNQRFAYLPLQKANGRYFLDPVFLGKLSTRDIERFAGLAGVRGLFPSLNDDFLRDIFDTRVQEAWVVKGHHYEDLTGKEAEFKLLEGAITGRYQVGFDYRKPEGLKPYLAVSPYRLVNQKGIWYLAALDGEKLKTFSFAKISRVRLLEASFPWSDEIAERLAKEDGVWMSDVPIDVRLRIAPEVAGYFKRRNLIANQVIEEECPDGSLLLSARVGHAKQVLPIVRYWMPYLRVISPGALAEDLEQGLRDYLASGRSADDGA